MWLIKVKGLLTFFLSFKWKVNILLIRWELLIRNFILQKTAESFPQYTESFVVLHPQKFAVQTYNKIKESVCVKR